MIRPIAAGRLISLALPLMFTIQSPSNVHAGEAGTWQIVEAYGPSQRIYHNAVYDRARKRMILFGGGGNTGAQQTQFNDVWVLDLDNPGWSQIAVAGTPPHTRQNALMIYDSKRDRLVVLGGQYDSGQIPAPWVTLQDIWELTLDGTPTWTELSTAGAPQNIWLDYSAVYDALNDRMVLWNGASMYQLSFSGGGWSELGTQGQPVPNGPGLVVDYPRNRLVTYGSNSATWRFNLNNAQWNTIFPAQPWPPNRGLASVIYDAGRDRLIVYGGHQGGVGYLSDLWELSLAGSPVWNPLTPDAPGGVPPVRVGTTCVYDQVHGRMVMFGGGTFFNSPYLDTWFLQWTAPVAGIEDPIDMSHLSLRAAWNRASSSVDVSFTLPRAGNARLDLYDLGGRRVASQQLDRGAGTHSAFFMERGLPSGLYALALRFDDESVARKVMVLR